MKRYWPLFALVLTATLEAMALTYSTNEDMTAFMHFFMGFTLCQFALLKLFHPAAFVEGFQKYDLVAKNFLAYGYAYPLIELGLGLSYISFFNPVPTYVVTILVMGIGAIGVIRALRQGLDVRCACMGTVLDVPLSTVTLSEDIGMGAMACWMLIGSFYY